MQIGNANSYHPIPLKIAKQTGKPFRPTAVRHFLLSLEPMDSLDGQKATVGRIKFNLYEKKTQNVDPYDMKKYLKSVAPFIPKSGSVPFVSPYDIDIDSQCVVVIELDSRINWQFCKQGYAATTAELYSEENFHLRHVYLDSSQGPGRRNLVDSLHYVAEDGCRMIAFNAYARKGGVGHKFNFHIEFKQDNKGLVTIFDPDIKNPGNTSFP